MVDWLLPSRTRTDYCAHGSQQWRIIRDDFVVLLPSEDEPSPKRQRLSGGNWLLDILNLYESLHLITWTQCILWSIVLALATAVFQENRKWIHRIKMQISIQIINYEMKSASGNPTGPSPKDLRLNSAASNTTISTTSTATSTTPLAAATPTARPATSRPRNRNDHKNSQTRTLMIFGKE